MMPLAFYLIECKMKQNLGKQRGQIHCKLERSETRRVFICYYTLIPPGHICRPDSHILLIYVYHFSSSSSFAITRFYQRDGHICRPHMSLSVSDALHTFSDDNVGLHCISFHSTRLHCILLHCVMLHCISVSCHTSSWYILSLLYIALHHVALHRKLYTALHNTHCTCTVHCTFYIVLLTLQHAAPQSILNDSAMQVRTRFGHALVTRWSSPETQEWPMAMFTMLLILSYL